MDLDGDEDNPYDFVAQYHRLVEERKKKVATNSNENKESNATSSTNKLDSDITVVSTINTSTKSTASTSSYSAASTSKPLADLRSGRVRQKNKRKRNDVESYRVNGPVICIGDFDDGYNMPPPKVPTTKVVDDFDLSDILDRNNEDADDEIALAAANRVINVKVYWRKMKTHRFPLRMFQSIESIYEYFAKLENTDKSFIYLELRKKPLSPTDSPNSINYKITDFIDGEVEYYISPYDERFKNVENEEKEEEIKFRILQKNVRHPFYMSIKKSDKMLILYIKLSEKLNLDVKSFTLEFDGDKIKKSDTVETLDLDGDECFELFEKSK